jgi:hypothetical protein
MNVRWVLALGLAFGSIVGLLVAAPAPRAWAMIGPANLIAQLVLFIFQLVLGGRLALLFGVAAGTGALAGLLAKWGLHESIGFSPPPIAFGVLYWTLPLLGFAMMYTSWMQQSLERPGSAERTPSQRRREGYLIVASGVFVLLYGFVLVGHVFAQQCLVIGLIALGLNHVYQSYEHVSDGAKLRFQRGALTVSTIGTVFAVVATYRLGHH